MFYDDTSKIKLFADSGFQLVMLDISKLWKLKMLMIWGASYMEWGALRDMLVSNLASTNPAIHPTKTPPNIILFVILLLLIIIIIIIWSLSAHHQNRIIQAKPHIHPYQLKTLRYHHLCRQNPSRLSGAQTMWKSSLLKTWTSLLNGLMINMQQSGFYE